MKPSSARITPTAAHDFASSGGNRAERDTNDWLDGWMTAALPIVPTENDPVTQDGRGRRRSRGGTCAEVAIPLRKEIPSSFWGHEIASEDLAKAVK